MIALARPVWLADPIEKTESTLDLMLLVDLSGSMETEDFKDPRGQRISRLDAVKGVLSEFIERRKSDRLGLIVFGNEPFLQAPFTRDHEVVRTLLDQTRTRMAGPQTAIGDAIGLALKHFESTKSEHRVVVLLTDGNDTGSKVPPKKAAEIFSAGHYGPLEGRLMEMLAGVKELTLEFLNEATQAWVELEYNRAVHRELGCSPVERFAQARSVLRPSPTSDRLREAFRCRSTRRQRQSDGTISLEGVRFEIPGRYRHFRDVTVRYARWDLRRVDLVDPQQGTIDPINQTNIPGLEQLGTADMMVIATRFRELPDEQMKYIDQFVHSGKPILGLRTATHAFSYSRNQQSPYAKYSFNFRGQPWEGGFGRQGRSVRKAGPNGIAPSQPKLTDSS